MARHKIEIFSAGCHTCKSTIELVKKLAGSDHDVQIHDMHSHETANKAKEHGIHRVPAVVINGKLAACCAGRAVDEHTLRQALAAK
jgi:glutaredoxin